MGDREAVRESPFTQDVDAIGAICFDLLVGASPLRVGNVPLPKLSREIVDRGPRQLIGGSQAVWSEQLESLVYRTLRRDLDHSVRSATEDTFPASISPNPASPRYRRPQLSARSQNS